MHARFTCVRGAAISCAFIVNVFCLQETIKTDFKDCTVITIAHRIDTIVNYDRVGVYLGGYRVLLCNYFSVSSSLCRILFGFELLQVLVLSEGQIEEFGSPRVLYDKKDSLFRSLCLQAGVQPGTA